MTQPQTIQLPSQTGDPVWELADLFPSQGVWSDFDYLSLDTNRLIEFSDGHIEVLPMPSQTHQFLVAYLYRLLFNHVLTHQLGKVLFAPLRVRIRSGKYREPDVVFVKREHAAKRHERYWDGADLVMEVVSPDDPQRDLVDKRRDYARAGIPEYWIVNPINKEIVVLTLPLGAEEYVVHGVFGRGDTAVSLLLDGFTAVVSDVFDAPEE